MKKNKKYIIAFILLVVLSGGVYLMFYLHDVFEYKQAMKSIEFQNINITNVADGVYQGEYDVNLIKAKVEVSVQDGAITNITILEHKNDRGQAAEAVIDHIVEAQQVDVDAISSATNSSNVLKKAVELALRKGIADVH